MSATLTPDRLTAVDLTDLPNANMAAIRREAIRRGISIGQLVKETMHGMSQRLVDAADPDKAPTTPDIIRAATAAAGGHHFPEGQN